MAKRVVIVGGGASGLMAAITAAQMGAVITIIEHKEKIGKKILMTGNGKCNLTNMSDIRGKYYGNDLERIYTILEKFPAAATRAFFEEIGLYTKEKRDGGVYPVSEQAASVLDILRTECEHGKVQVLLDTELIEILPEKTGGTVVVETAIKEEVTGAKKKKGTASTKTVVVGTKLSKLPYDSLILATGGQAAAVSGSDGSGYRFAKRLGHTVIKPLPALVQLQCEGDFFAMVAGVRAQASLELYIRDKKCACEEGELQLTDYGISGIPVFQISRLAARAIYEQETGLVEAKKDSVVVKINFLPYMSEETLEYLIKNKSKFGYKTIEEFLGGIVHKKVAVLICHRLSLNTSSKVEQLSEREFKSCLDFLRNFPVVVTGTKSYDSAQVCCGGIPLSEITETMESLKCPDVYLVGELLDCDGICGGYNLQWAWTTGRIAGEHAAMERE